MNGEYGKANALYHGKDCGPEMYGYGAVVG